MPDGLRIAELAAKTSCPTVDDFWHAWQDDADHGLAPPLPSNIRVPPVFAPPARLRIPNGLRWEDGPYTHQGRAVHAWEENAGRGILAIATGGGKTIAALVAATRLQSAAPRLFITVAAPFKPLIEQWHREVSRFGVTPVPLANLDPAERTGRLGQAVLALEIGHSDVELAIVSHTLLNQPDFRAFLQSIPPEVATLLIADEVHNLGAPGFSRNPPQEFRFRLGLSATPVRQYDEAGTEALLDYFGDVVFEFDLGAAIRTGCLTPYNYYLHPVALDDGELTEWEELTERLRRLGFGAYNEASEELPHDVKLLLFRRRGILENAHNKVATLRSLLLAGDPSSLRHTLIYTSAKHRPGQPTQITQVNRMMNEIGVVAHELTYNETGTGIASEILESFSNGLYQAVTCMKVLDEGVDVPQTTSAYILASSTVRREWVQRRGRILRRAPGKTVAHLHDFLVVPPDPQSPTGRSILRQELERGREFASLAENSAATDGPWEVMARYEPFAT
jgi:superfamily II DNA or RNA helicase